MWQNVTATATAVDVAVYADADVAWLRLAARTVGKFIGHKKWQSLASAVQHVACGN